MDGDIQAVVKRVVCDQIWVNEESVSDDTRLVTDLGYDSLDHIELVVALEDEFDIDVSDEEVERFTNATTPEITAAIGLHLAEKAG